MWRLDRVTSWSCDELTGSPLSDSFLVSTGTADLIRACSFLSGWRRGRVSWAVDAPLPSWTLMGNSTKPATCWTATRWTATKAHAFLLRATLEPYPADRTYTTTSRWVSRLHRWWQQSIVPTSELPCLVYMTLIKMMGIMRQLFLLSFSTEMTAHKRS